MKRDLRLATPRDAERVAQLAKDTFLTTFADRNTRENMNLYVEEAFSLEAIQAEIADPASTYLWAVEKGIPVGYAKLRRGAPAECVTGAKPVELQRMYATTKKIGSGVGKGLLHMTIKIAKSEGFTTLWLGVWEHNDRAIEFYKRQGFVDVGQHDFWLGKDRQIDRIMQLTLTA
jgi:GNAT superfamily N-acetyltransferase